MTTSLQEDQVPFIAGTVCWRLAAKARKAEDGYQTNTNLDRRYRAHRRVRAAAGITNCG